MVNEAASFLAVRLILGGWSLGVGNVIHGEEEWWKMAGEGQEFLAKLIGPIKIE